MCGCCVLAIDNAGHVFGRWADLGGDAARRWQTDKLELL
jgi:hypothetical protein